MPTWEIHRKKDRKKHQKNKRIRPKNLHSLFPSLPTLKLSHYLISFFALSNIMKDQINNKNPSFIIYIYIYKDNTHSHEKEIIYYLTIIKILIQEANNKENIPMFFF